MDPCVMTMDENKKAEGEDSPGGEREVGGER